ncbi:hypothetical protein M501DRAFT_927914 [Patellaria atrata CBS 101060]|uniref:Uncharacterized protein n=1 Tax=Patellaria atrata CBS 101060 TaxID=1346257 RepID=A0A9P4SGD0_9PEZI|nr:hypothetical protein M501DRAFT_927914 [Patellaria atrata CBS 101060]
MSTLGETANPAHASVTSRSSSVPHIQETSSQQIDNNEPEKGTAPSSISDSTRKLFGLVKKKTADKASKDNEASGSKAPVKPQPLPLNQTPTVNLAGTSPQRSPRMSAAIASPTRRYRSSSPGFPSPASSQIFERNVQESAALSGELSPAIPAHIQTEDRIPPTLEAASEAITDDHLNPDEVEIVTHAAHQPAAVSVVSGVASNDGAIASLSQEDVTGHQDIEEAASTYGSLDPTDVRRLSFISFADVVQSEHVGSSRDSMHHMSLSSATANRSPSPVRSPASSHGQLGTSPPTSGTPSMKGVDGISAKVPSKAPGSPITSHSPPVHGELTVETMRQALRKTGSGDLSGARSQPLSPVLGDEHVNENSPFR